MREFINFAKRVTEARIKVKEINKDFIDDNLDALAKTEKDAEVFNDRLEGLVLDAQQEKECWCPGLKKERTIVRLKNWSPI